MIKETPAKTLASVFAAAATFVATAATWIDGEGLLWTYSIQDDETLMIEKCNRISTRAPDGVLTLPATIKNKTVTAIKQNAFENCTEITSVTIPDSIKEIKEYAFFHCTALTNVKLSATLKIIGRHAFSMCTSLESLTIPSGITEIGAFAFSECSSLKTLYFLGDAPQKYDNCLENSSANLQVTIPLSLPGWSSLNIGEYWMGKKVVVLMPDGGPYTQTVDGVEWSFTIANAKATLCGNGFAEPAISRSVTGDVSVPAKLGGCEVEAIGAWAFYYCQGLTSISLPDTVVSIAEQAFEGCKSLHAMRMPLALERVGGYAFYNCSALKRVAFTGKVKQLDTFAFCGCVSLESIAFNGDAPSLGSNVFLSCPSTCKILVEGGSTWPAAGNAWNGMTVYNLNSSPSLSFDNNLPDNTFFRPDSKITIQLSFPAKSTDSKLSAIASKMVYAPADPDLDPRFFKAKAVATSDLILSFDIVAELDLEAMEFAKTSKEVVDQMAAATGESAPLTLTSAKPGFWYAVAAADSLAALNMATQADAAGRASSQGVSLTVSKPKGSSAFFKVQVSPEKIGAK